MIAIVLSSVVSAVVCVGIYVLVTRFITKNTIRAQREAALKEAEAEGEMIKNCLLYTSPSPRDKRQSRMPSSA